MMKRLMVLVNNQKYSFEKKISVVELYLSGSEISYQDLAIQEGLAIKADDMITNWVNRFRAAGPDALKSRKKVEENVG